MAIIRQMIGFQIPNNDDVIPDLERVADRYIVSDVFGSGEKTYFTIFLMQVHHVETYFWCNDEIEVRLTKQFHFRDTNCMLTISIGNFPSSESHQIETGNNNESDFDKTGFIIKRFMSA